MGNFENAFKLIKLLIIILILAIPIALILRTIEDIKKAKYEKMKRKIVEKQYNEMINKKDEQ